jgi:SNF2 family DNA or RNA helicase
MTLPDFLKTPHKKSAFEWGTLKLLNETELRTRKEVSLWLVEGHPQMISKIKSVFPGCRGSSHEKNTVTFSVNKRNTGDLNWFLLRYPLKLVGVETRRTWKELLGQAAEYFEIREQMLKNPMLVVPKSSGEKAKHFHGTLYEFQKEGLAFLKYNERALLADEQGLGKTPTALAWLTEIEEKPPYLLVVPPTLIPQWKREIQNFLGSSMEVTERGRLKPITDESLKDTGEEKILIHVITGQPSYNLPKADFYIIHYLLLSYWKNILSEFDFGAVVFDEIHELRHTNSMKYSAASLIAENVDKVAGLSGTPFFNYGAEIFSVINIIERNALGDYGSFTREWAYGYGHPVITDPERLGEYLRTEGLYFRRLKEDVLKELPPKRRVIQAIDVDYGTYDRLIAPVIEQAARLPDIKDFKLKGQMTRQAIDVARRATGIAKAHYVSAFVAGLIEAGEPTILYGHHHDVIDIYLEDLKQYNPVFITGRQSAKAKDDAQMIFMGNPKAEPPVPPGTDLIVVSLVSGLGLNLQRAKCVVFGELDYCPSRHSQCEDRAHRIGQLESLLIYYLCCEEGTDVDIQQILGLKASQFTGIMGDNPETDEDKILATEEAKKHLDSIVNILAKGGRRKGAPSPEVLARIKEIERMRPNKDEIDINESSVSEVRKTPKMRKKPPVLDPLIAAIDKVSEIQSGGNQ